MDAGWGGLTVFSALARTLPFAGKEESSMQSAAKVTAAALADAFETYLAAYGANSTNFLAYAPGGGVENMGLSQAINDMLIQSSNGTIHLFPAWPRAEPAEFTTLRTKGAFLVSAKWDHVHAAATDVAITATVLSPKVSLASPFGAAAKTAKMQCSSGGRTVAVDARGVLEWSMKAGEVCAITPIVM